MMIKVKEKSSLSSKPCKQIHNFIFVLFSNGGECAFTWTDYITGCSHVLLQFYRVGGKILQILATNSEQSGSIPEQIWATGSASWLVKAAVIGTVAPPKLGLDSTILLFFFSITTAQQRNDNEQNLLGNLAGCYCSHYYCSSVGG